MTSTSGWFADHHRAFRQNAILIVEFAVEMMQKEGKTPIEAIIGGADAFTPNPDDLSGLYSRRAAAGYQSWCRFWRAKRGRYRRDGRDVCRNSAGNLLRSGLFVVVEHLFARFKKRNV